MCKPVLGVFFFKQKTAYEIGLGIPAEPLFRSRLMLGMVVVFIAFRWIHLSTPLIRLFLLELILLLMPTLNFLPVWFALSLLRIRLPSRLPMMFILWMVAMMVVIIPSRTVRLLTSFPVRRAIMFMLVLWFVLTLPLLNAADWFR